MAEKNKAKKEVKKKALKSPKEKKLAKAEKKNKSLELFMTDELVEEFILENCDS